MFFLGETEKTSDEVTRALGKKAYNLHLLRRAGFKVPPGFVVTPKDPLDEGILKEAIDKLGGFPVAVRSSGQIEDLEGASFAGLYETFLNIEGLSQLQEAIKKCFHSGESPRVLDYLKKKNMAGEIATPEDLKSRLSVLVQKMVDAQYAGVAFSINPLTGREEHLLVEVCRGLGEKLVSGQVTPSQYVLNYREDIPFSYEEGGEKVRLSLAHLQDLKTACLEIQGHFGSPQDIEWAIDGGDRLWLLQSRPITKIEWRYDLGEFTNADLKDGGVSARVCTPMMFSLYQSSNHKAMPRYLRDIGLWPKEEKDLIPEESQWMISVYGRVFWNAGLVKKCLMRVPGFNEETFDKDLGIQKDYGKEGPRKVPLNAKTLVRGLLVLFRLHREYQDCLDTLPVFYREFDLKDRYWKDLLPRLPGLEDQEICSLFIRLIEEMFWPAETAYYRTIYNNSNFQSDFKSFLNQMDKHLGGTTSLLPLMSGLADVAHMKVQKGIFRLYGLAQERGPSGPDWEKEMVLFLKDHYHHGEAELELKTPRWGEKPEIIVEMIQNMIRSRNPPVDPEESQKKQEKFYHEELQKIHERMNKASWWTRRRFSGKVLPKTSRLRSFLSHRERMRECSTRSYFLVRLFLLELGGRMVKWGWIKREEDIFLFHIQEVLQVLGFQDRGKSLPENLQKDLHYRHHFYRGYSKFEAPNEFGQNVLQRTEESYSELVSGKSAFKGIPCSGGIYEGTARVIVDLQEVHLIQKGDILVTKFTDPGWTPVLGLVSGIITEVGGVLSHAAVIGREYGIPAVLNIPGVTQKIQSGQRIRLNGHTGIIEFLDEEEEEEEEKENN